MVGDQRVDLDLLRLQRLAAGEGEQALGEVGTLEGGVERLLAELAHVGIVLAAHDQHVEAADDDGEQVVEVVGHAAGKVADGLHLLRLAELGLDLLLAGEAFAHVTLELDGLALAAPCWFRPCG